MRKSWVLYLPIYAFTFIWALTFFLYYLNPFNLPPLRTYTWVVLLSGITMVYAGFLSGKFLSQGFKFEIVSFVSTREHFPFAVEPLKKLLFYFTTISLIGILGRSFLVIQAMGGIEEYIINPTYTRNFIIQVDTRQVEVNIILLKLFSYMSSFTFACVIVGGVLYTIPKSKLIGIYPLLVSVIAAVINFQRGEFIRNYIFWLICAFIFSYYLPKYFQRKNLYSIFRQIIYFLVIFVIFSLFILLLRFFFASQGNITFIINSFYFYIVGNLWTLDQYLLTDPQPLYGLSIFRSFASWFSALQLVDKSSVLALHNEFFPIYNTAMNTFTFIRIPYDDFRFPGVLVISYFLGIIAFSSMKAFVKKFSFFRLGLAALLTNLLLWSFYNLEIGALTLYVIRFIELFLLDFFLERFNLYQT